MRSYFLLNLALPLVLLLTCTPCLQAQESNATADSTTIHPTKTNYKRVVDVVYLNNGWVLRGRIQYYQPGEKVRIQTSDGSEFVFYGDEIKQVTQEPVKVPKTKAPAMQGSYLAFNVCFGSGSDQYGGGATTRGTQVSMGTMVSRRLALGAGIGSEWYQNGRLLPITAETRYRIGGEWRHQPYLRAFAGYSLGWLAGNPGVSHKGGPTLGADAGILTKISHNAAVNLSLGVGWQRERLGYFDWWTSGEVTEVNEYQRLWVRLGFLF